ncbi:MAG: methylphosphotriester-DNA--protein-cysteine methyltransferase family protein [Candidatus Heimdallarchaeota archaeon]|nr:MAG: methylphosphotriester-DNA--protein-cysteine methyltransferase family protein [Candidatus Heimdallarchaeota archaeon]
MQKIPYTEMLKARKRRDARYDGRFYIGIRTMKTYCLPSCKAKLALEKNLVFFSTKEEAISAGYRSCKRCLAGQFPNTYPLWLEILLTYLKDKISEKITEDQLVQIANVDISTIRRHFKSLYGLTPISYHRKLRLMYAKELIEKGVEFKEIPSCCGFKSISGFRTAFIKEFGHSPGEINSASF